MNSIYSMLGIASKAGKLISGDETVRNAIRSKQAKLIIITEDASVNTNKRFINSSTYYDIPYLIWGSKQQIGHYIGKGERAVIGITDENFSNKIVNMIVLENNKQKNTGGESIE